MITIIVVDDHHLVRMGISRILNDIDGFRVIATVKSGEEAIHSAKNLSPDVVMMDVKMPGMGGVEATRRIKLANKNTHVIAVTSCSSDLYPSQLMQAGASAYITKQAAPEEMIEAINNVVTGKPFMSNDIARQLALKSAKNIEGNRSALETLSTRELQVVTMLIRGQHSSEIANILNVTVKTINSFRYRIFAKLQINSDVELLLFAVKHRLFDVDSLE